MNIKHIITLVACLAMLFSLGCAHKPTSSWVGAYQIPNNNEAGIVVADFYILADKLDVTCSFHNNTYNFDGTGRLKGKIDDQKFILSGMLIDKAQGRTLIELNGTIRGDTLEGSFVQKTIGGDISITGGMTMVRTSYNQVRTSYTTYRGDVTWQRHTVADQQLIDLGAASQGLLGPGRADVYGPGIHADATGRPFSWRTEDGSAVIFGRVKENAYGLGVGMDQFGRPVRARPLW